MFWGTRATNFSIYTTKMEGAGPKILGTGAKFKQVPCQKNCRVNRAYRDCHRGPHSRSEILYNNEDITGTATAVRSPIVKYCIIMRTLQGLPPRSAVKAEKTLATRSKV